ncbi:MAG: hypothetical protein ACYC64_02005 [Armatimonadota bacterium]
MMLSKVDRTIQWIPMMGIIALGVIISLVSPAFGSNDLPADYYVSPNGRDIWSGKLAVPNAAKTDGPFATIEKARDTIRKQGAGKAVRSKAWVVLIREGVYTPKSTIVFTPADSGSKKVPVIYAAYYGETPILSGGQKIAGWKKLAEETPGLAVDAKGNVWAADIPKGWLFHYMFVNGERQQRAITPNTEDWSKWPTILGVGERAPGGQTIQFPAGALANVPGNGDVEMCFLPSWRWMNELPVLRDVDPVKSTAKRHSKNVSYAGKAGDPYRLENALVALDQPGEWCVDSARGRVYYWPKSGSMAGLEVIAPKLCNLMRFQGLEDNGPWVHNIVIKGLTFEYTDRLPEDRWPEAWLARNFENPDAAVFMQGVEDCTIERNRFMRLGTYAVALDHHAQRNHIIGNEMGYLGCGGVQLYGYGPGTTDVNKFNEISMNHIHHTGLAPYWHSASITISGSNSNVLKLNYMHDLPYSAIMICGPATEYWNERKVTEPDAYGYVGSSFHFRWNELPAGSYERWQDNRGMFDDYSIMRFLHTGHNYMEYNLTERFMKKLHDGGALYCYYVGAGNTWRKNAVYNDSDTYLLNPIYMDAGTNGALLEGNVVCAPGKVWDNNGSGANKWVAGMSKFPHPDKIESNWKNNTMNGQEIPAFPYWFAPPFVGVTPEYQALVNEIVDEVKRQGGWLGEVSPVGSE